MIKQITRRQLLSVTLAAGVTTSLAQRDGFAANANNEIGLGFISCGDRAGKLMSQFDEMAGVNVTALCDVDASRLGVAKERYPAANSYRDMRDLLEDQSVDAVVISTCNHWHCLAAIWAMQAGKDVYVEKPLSHSQWEGKQVVAAAKKYDRICQVGTQQRSDPMQAEIKKFLHEEKTLGEIQTAQVNHYMIRKPIGRRDMPLPIDKSIAYDLWSGPAEKRPLFRDNLHYDWHWDWNTGSGEMGNWGVHILDDVRNNVFQDSVGLPIRILAGGGRVIYNDAGQTPNVHFAYFETGSIPVVIGLTNLPAKPGSKDHAKHQGPNSGYIAYCEGGRYEGQRGRGVAFDADGKQIRTFIGNRGDVDHQANFIDAVRSHDESVLHANVTVGNDSTGWCNLANIAFQAGQSFSEERAGRIELSQWRETLTQMNQHLTAHGLRLDDENMQLSPMLQLDPKTERFIGEHAAIGNQFLKREYRSGFEVPEFLS
jgi:predicted dehydrogenase